MDHIFGLLIHKSLEKRSLKKHIGVDCIDYHMRAEDEELSV